MQELHTVPRTGAEVLVRGHRWTVVHTRAFPHCALVSLEGRDAGNAGQHTTLLAPFDRFFEPSAARLPRQRRALLIRNLLRAVAQARPAGGLWSGTAGAFDVHPWQLAPVLAVLDGTTRMLLADAVGLGKTIQAGLVLAELQQRGLLERALVLAPPALREMWCTELAARLGVTARLVDQAALSKRAHEIGSWHNPWAGAAVIVSSIDLVKRPDVRASVEAEPLDLLVVDEAHHATPDSDRGAAVARLARQATWVVLCSATPHAGHTAGFEWLLQLGHLQPGEPPMHVFRRTRHDATLAAGRRTRAIHVRPGSAEAELHRELLAYAHTIASASPHTAAPLLATTLVRRAASSAWAAACTLTRRLAALSRGEGSPPATHAVQPALPWEELDQEDDTEAAGVTGAALPDTEHERHLVAALAALAQRAAETPSKFLALRRLVRRCREPVVVFTEFRDTLYACHRWLHGVAPTVCLHGGMDVAERARVLREFLAGDARVLLATDVAGEGLNLQHRARVVITLEWPWNPQRLEQRIGRVDRLGQPHTVHAVHLTARDSFEQTVVARMVSKALQAEQDLNAIAPLEPALRAALLDTAAPVTGPPDVPDRRRARSQLSAAPHELPRSGVHARGDGASRTHADAARLTHLRAIAASADRGTTAAHGQGIRPLRPRGQMSRTTAASLSSGWAVPPRRTRPTALVVLFVATTLGASGRMNAQEPVAVMVTLTRSPPHRRAWRQACRQAARDTRVRDTAMNVLLANGEVTWTAARDRLQAIAAHMAQAQRRETQPSLFDRRGLRDASRMEAGRLRLLAHVQRRLAWLDADGDDRTRKFAPTPDTVHLRVAGVLPLAIGADQ